jgi:hypothetical protein
MAQVDHRAVGARVGPRARVTGQRKSLLYWRNIEDLLRERQLRIKVRLVCAGERTGLCLPPRVLGEEWGLAARGGCWAHAAGTPYGCGFTAGTREV